MRTLATLVKPWSEETAADRLYVTNYDPVIAQRPAEAVARSIHRSAIERRGLSQQRQISPGGRRTAEIPAKKRTRGR
jgi:hypothetical protein